MDIWTTLVQLRKCNTSHASKWGESIALSVCRGPKVPWQLCLQAGQSLGAGCRSCLPSVLQHFWGSPRWFQPWWSCGPSASLRSGSWALWCCSGEAEKGRGWSGSHRSHLFLWTPDSWAQLKIIVAVAHMQLTEILSFNLASANAECLCFILKILGHRGTEHRFIMILFLEYLNCCWRDRLYWLKRTGITKQTRFDLRLDIFAKTKLYKI